MQLKMNAIDIRWWFWAVTLVLLLRQSQAGRQAITL